MRVGLCLKPSVSVCRCVCVSSVSVCPSELFCLSELVCVCVSFLTLLYLCVFLNSSVSVCLSEIFCACVS
jgi:hypothetical protein